MNRYYAVEQAAKLASEDSDTLREALELLKQEAEQPQPVDDVEE